MYVNVTVSPAPAHGLGGTVTVAYTTSGGDPVSVDLPLASGGTVSTTRDVPRGDHAWTATFHGTDAWRPSTSASVTKHAGVATTLSVATEVNPVTAGDPVVLHASLVADGYELPPGTVTFREGSGPVLASDAVGPGDTVANASISSLALGTHDIRASYVSSADGSPASDVARVFVVSKGIQAAWTATIPMVGDAPLQLGPIASDGGGVYVAGETFGTAVGEVSAGGRDLVVARIDPASGTLVWVTQLGSVADDSLDDLTVTPQGVFVTGSSPGTMVAGGPSGGPYPFVARLTLGGAMTWAAEGDRPSDTWRVAPGIDGGVYVAGTASLTAAPDRQGGQVRRYTAGGTRLWEREVASCCWLGKPGYLELRSLTSDQDGLLVGGSAAGSVTGGNDEVNRGWLRRLTPSGSTVWTRELAGPYGSVVTDLLASNEATILAVGNSTAPIAGQPNAAPAQNVWARRYAFNGATTWTKALSRGTVVASCRTFVATNHSEILPSGRRGGSIAELRLDGRTAGDTSERRPRTRATSSSTPHSGRAGPSSRCSRRRRERRRRGAWSGCRVSRRQPAAMRRVRRSRSRRSRS